MKKCKLLGLALAMIMSLSLWIVPASAAEEDDYATHAANVLYDLGLFRGVGNNPDGTPNFDLDRAPSREEAVTMLVRLLGKDKEATAGTWTIPFTDVSDWAKPYVGYAYNNSLTNGVSSTSFGGQQTVTASQYITYVLRSLGYSSDTDFYWDTAWELSDEIGVTYGEYNEETTSFTRGDIAMISESALYVEFKSNEDTLLTFLNNSGALVESKKVLMDFDVITTSPNKTSFAFFPIQGSPNTYTSFQVNQVTVNGLPCSIIEQKTNSTEANTALSSVEASNPDAFNYTVLRYDEAKVKEEAGYSPSHRLDFLPLVFTFECTGTLKDGTIVNETFSTFVTSMHGAL